MKHALMQVQYRFAVIYETLSILHIHLKPSFYLCAHFEDKNPPLFVHSQTDIIPFVYAAQMFTLAFCQEK